MSATTEHTDTKSDTKNDTQSDGEGGTDTVNENETNNEEEISTENDNFINLIPNTDLYLLSKDEEPLGFFKDKKLAQETMWKVARINKLKYMTNYNVYISEDCDENNISIVGYQKFIIIAYGRVFSRFKITTVKQMELYENLDSDKVLSSTTKETTTKKTSYLSNWW